MNTTALTSKSLSLKKWNIKVYSRLEPSDNMKIPGNQDKSGSIGEWKAFESSPTLLIKLAISADGHMLITCGNTVHENIFLPFVKSNTRSSKVFQKKEMLVFWYTVNCESRMFRVQFSEENNKSAEKACKECAEELSLYFAFRAAPEEKIQEESNVEAPNQDISNPGGDPLEKGINVFASKILKNEVADLPLIYRECQFQNDCSGSHEDEQKVLEKFLCLCLADPSFPSFVDKVERTLTKLTETISDS